MKISELILIISLIYLFSCNEKKNINKELPKDYVAKINDMSGELNLKKAQELKWTKAAVNHGLYNFDTLKTGSDSSAKIEYQDKSSVEMGQKSFLIIVDSISSIKKDIKIIDLKKGELKGNIVKLKNKENELQVKTKKVTVKIRPVKKFSKFKVSLKENEGIIIENNSADVKVEKEDETLIVKNEQTIVIKDKPKIIKKDEFLITYPENNYETKKESILIKGRLVGYRALINGKSIKSKNERFNINMKLEKGLNILTFQIFKGDQVEYKVLKVYRK